MKNTPTLFQATLVAAAVAASVSPAYSIHPNNPPSFEAGEVPTATPCDGLITIPGWAQNVTDGDGETSGLSFRITNVSNPELFSQLPFVSWPSLTLSYQLMPGIEGLQSSTVSAILMDTSGTGQGGSDTSEPVTWVIPAEGCNDADNDGIDDSVDPDVDMTDTDGDGLPDTTDPDDDNDGLTDQEEGDGTVDTDNDGIPDSLDQDSDSDGIPDAEETGDSDNDGIPDSQEPEGTDVSTDTDGDGIPDDTDTDDDNDGIPDVEEGDGQVDTDGDGIPDSRDPDSNDDGIPDGADAATDTDGDGIPDDTDTDDDNDGLSDDEEGNGEVDTDGDGIPDSLDPDSNNDGIGDDGGPVVDPQSGDDSDPEIRTGLRGSGSAFDPLLAVLALITGGGLFRRKQLRSREAGSQDS